MTALDKFLLNSVFDRADFSEDQIEEMELGLQNNQKIFYANPKYSAAEMRKFRQPLKLSIKES